MNIKKASAMRRNRGEPKTSSVSASDVAHEARDHQCLSGEKTRSTPMTLAEANVTRLPPTPSTKKVVKNL